MASALTAIGLAYKLIGDDYKFSEYVAQGYFIYSKVLGKDHYKTKNSASFLRKFEFFPQNYISRERIRKRGEMDSMTFKIKQQLQKQVLTPIIKLAEGGYWHSGRILPFVVFRDWGIAGYIDEKYLQKQLGTLLTSTSEYNKIMDETKMLCFEAICLGIMYAYYGERTTEFRHTYNMCCAYQFTQLHPAIIQKIVKFHPDYFVDGSILRVCVKDPKVLTDLLGR